MKRILITGTSSGIGKVIAVFLTEQGHQVIGTSRKGSQHDDLVDTIRLDITEDASVSSAVAEAIAKLGAIDVLINNAGIGISGPVEDTPMDEVINQFESNYFGLVRMTREVIPVMKQNGGGLIINVGSVAGKIGLPFQAHYSASKHALKGFTEGLRFELRPFNISVVNILPADFVTPFTANRQGTQNITSDYKSEYQRFMTMYEADERNGADPILIAKLAAKLVKMEQGFKPKYLVGKRSQTIGVFLKRFLGDRLFEWVLTKFWTS